MAADALTSAAQRLCALMIAAAECPAEASTLALAGVVSRWRERPPPYAQPVAGLEQDTLLRLLQLTFPGLPGHLCKGLAELQVPLGAQERCDEFDDLLALLGEHRCAEGEPSHWLAHAIATACMADNHLWQDMGLPNRGVLNALLREHFTLLYLKNVGDMKWKKFFYKQLCERAELPICKSPSCGVCVDFKVCFGPEDRPEPGWLAQKGPALVGYA